MEDPAPYDRHESEAQRLDRNFNEQLQEVRIAQAGVQILFAFLLTLPFQSRFTVLNEVQLRIYFAILVASALSVVLFTAPVAMHRVLFRQGVKDFVVRYTSALVSWGLFTLAVAIVGGVFLVLDVLFSATPALAVCTVLGLLTVALWLVLPGWRKRTNSPRAQRLD
ncbi:MAG: DUF6328 family protein [Intrasporangium sp.]|uniref:DUF6328 family protein n=1 Tax=Intrasporangium sp. TaxID=1925024 RepID=UPI0026497C82|nr:DUF6328 family protein [Intrasporangium sp.]MDN5794909.1 DUF6328 family protein [Intrasporangium sp.]